MNTATKIAEQYLAAWNERDPVARRAMVANAFTLEAAYADPMASVSGHLGIDGLIGAVQNKFTGHRFELSGTPDSHNDAIRFSWSLVNPAGAPVAHGTDFGVISQDGRLSSVTGFLDNVA
ncbi:MAG: nuclear transport factor 2 family protein [Telluria sp.]